MGKLIKKKEIKMGKAIIITLCTINLIISLYALYRIYKFEKEYKK